MSMKAEDIETLMRAVSSVVRDQMATLVARIEAVEKKAAEPGREGRDADPETIRTIVMTELQRLPPPKDGEDGRDGRDGIDGTDAARMEVLDGIDPARKYQRGTCAAYRGGVIKAFRATDPLGSKPQLEKSGWQVLLNGVAEEEENQFEDGRVVQRITTYTNGQRLVRTHKRQIPIYRKVYKSGQTYDGGDVVTYGGSMWICIASSPTKLSPGTGSDSPVWTLCVKRGKSSHE